MTRPRWTAGTDGIAHAHVDRITACGVSPIAERYAWPETSRCPTCKAITARSDDRHAVDIGRSP